MSFEGLSTFVDTVAPARYLAWMSADNAQEFAADRLAGKKSPLDDLAPREVEILRLVASGMATETIAEAQHLSPKTVQNYHYGIKAKLGARNDAHLVWLAISAGVLRMSFKVEP